MNTAFIQATPFVQHKRFRILFTTLLVLTTLLQVTPVYSIGLPFLKEAPARFFSEKDWQILRQAVNHTLDEVPDGKTSTWQNRASGSKGVLKPVKTYKDHGAKCRTLKILNSAAGRIGESKFDYCKQADGVWKLAP